MPRPLLWYIRIIDEASEKIGLFAMYLIFAMVGVLIYDALTRNVFMTPVFWCVEMSKFLLAAYYTLGGAHSIQLGNHVRMDLVYEKLSSRSKALMDIITTSCVLFYLGCLLWGGISSATYSFEYNQKLMSVWNPLVWPIKFIMVFGIILLILQLLARALKDFAIWREIDMPGIKYMEEEQSA